MTAASLRSALKSQDDEEAYIFCQIYDLKGSTRNRHVQSTGRENEVLLDENLVESTCYRIIYTKVITTNSSGTS